MMDTTKLREAMSSGLTMADLRRITLPEPSIPDELSRIATALERIAAALERSAPSPEAEG